MPALATPEEMIDWAESKGTVKDLALFWGPDGLLRGGAAIDVQDRKPNRIEVVEWKHTRR